MQSSFKVRMKLDFCFYYFFQGCKERVCLRSESADLFGTFILCYSGMDSYLKLAADSYSFNRLVQTETSSFDKTASANPAFPI